MVIGCYGYEYTHTSHRHVKHHDPTQAQVHILSRTHKCCSRKMVCAMWECMIFTPLLMGT